MLPGKDGQPLDLARYVHWGLHGKSSMKLQRMKPRGIRKSKWFCPKCLAGPFVGAAIKKHREDGC